MIFSLSLSPPFTSCIISVLFLGLSSSHYVVSSWISGLLWLIAGSGVELILIGAVLS